MNRQEADQIASAAGELLTRAVGTAGRFVLLVACADGVLVVTDSSMDGAHHIMATALEQQDAAVS